MSQTIILNVYKTMELAGVENFIRRDQLIKVSGYQVSYKENRVHIYKIKAICFLLSTDQNMYILLLKQLRDGDNVGRD